MFQIKEKHINLINIFIYLLLVIFTSFILRNLTSWCEELLMYPPLSWSDLFHHPDHGSYLTYYIDLFMTWKLPKLLHIHPQDFVCTYGAVFRSILFVLFCYFLSLLTFINNKRTILHSVIFLICYFAVWAGISRNFHDIVNFAAFSRMYIPFIFFALFWVGYSKYFINVYDAHKPTRDFYFLCIIAFILGSVFEVTTVISVLGCLLVILYNKINHIKNTKFVILPFIFLLLGAYILFSNTEFLMHCQTKSHFENYNGVIINLKQYKDFFYIYYKEIIKANWICYIIIIFSTMFGFIIDKSEKSVRIEWLSLFLTIGFLMFFILLIFMGKTNYDGGWWVEHWGLKGTIRFCLLVPVFLSVSTIVHKIQYKNLTSFAAIVAFLVLILVLVSQRYLALYQNIIDFTYNRRVAFYKSEKTALYQFYKENNIVYVPMVNPIEIIDTYPYYYVAVYKIPKKQISIFYKSVKDANKVDNIKALFDKYPELKKCIFTEQELKELKFSRLYDKDFVLRTGND